MATETGDILRLACVMSRSGVDLVANTWYLKLIAGGPLTVSEVYANLADYADLMYEQLEARLSDELTADHLEAANVTQGLTFGSFAWQDFAGGLNTNQPTASQVCLLAFGRTTTPRVQIRKYLGVFTEEHMTDGLWNSVIRADALGMMVDHIQQQTVTAGATLQGVAYNRVTGTSVNGLSASTSMIPVIQRRRRIGRGS